MIEQAADFLGPSPRVRGSRHYDIDNNLLYGSIPACAGEPTGHII